MFEGCAANKPKRDPSQFSKLLIIKYLVYSHFGNLALFGKFRGAPVYAFRSGAAFLLL